MYRKAISLLLAGNLIVILGLLLTGAVSDAKTDSKPMSQLCLFSGDGEGGEIVLTLEEGKTDLTLEDMEKKARRKETGPASPQNISLGLGTADSAVSGQRVVDYALLEKSDLPILSEEELETLQRIVEAEAGSEDEEGRLLVANVVLNRVKSEKFPETVTEVVFQREKGVTQFSPVASGRYYTVEISDLTVSAVERALAGEDISEGALFFASRRYANSDKMRWFDENLTFLFKHGGHEFFK